MGGVGAIQKILTKYPNTFWIVNRSDRYEPYDNNDNNGGGGGVVLVIMVTTAITNNGGNNNYNC